MMATEKNNDQKELLKRLLLGEELDRLDEVDERVDRLERLCESKERFASRFVEVFREHIREKKEPYGLIEESLPLMIRERSAKNPESLGEAIEPVITPAIEKGIVQNKDRMIDALYPILGGMIAKYVTASIQELMEKINRKLDEGLSWKRYKRKAIAKLKGVDEGSLLLKEEGTARLRSLLVIHKVSGLLIAQVDTEQGEIDDPHLVASMATAIKDFINDWVSEQTISETKEVELVSYGDAVLYIESAGSVFFIGVYQGYPDHTARKKLHDFFVGVVKSYAEQLQNFQGDDKEEWLVGLHDDMKRFLAQSAPREDRSSSEKKSQKAVWLLWILSALMLVWGVYVGYRYYTIWQIKKEIYEHTGVDVDVVRSDEGGMKVVGGLGSIESYVRLEEYLKTIKAEPIENQTHLSAQAVAQMYHKHFTHNKELSTRVAHLIGVSQRLKELQKRHTSLQNTQENTAKALRELRYRIEALGVSVEALGGENKRLTQTLQEAQALLDLPERLRETLRKRFHNAPFFDPEDGALDFSRQNLFEVGELTLRPEAKEVLREAFERYLSTVLSVVKKGDLIQSIVIEGYSDTSGDKERNRYLSYRRAQHVKTFLSQLSIVQTHNLAERIVAIGKGESNPVIIEGKEDKNASRRIRIRLEIAHDRLMKEVEAVLK